MVSRDDAWCALLLPGMTLNRTIFPDLEIPSAAPDFSTMVLGPAGDLPRRSAHPMQVYEQRLDDLVARFEPWAGARRLVVGHSFGAMLALRWILSHGGAGPGRIDALVLIAATAGPMYGAASLRLARIGRREIRAPLSAVIGLWNRPVVTRAMKRLCTRGALAARPVDFRRLRRRSDVAVDLAGWRNTDWRAMRSFRLAMDGFDVRDHLPEIGVPTIVLHGPEDPLIPPSEGRALAEDMPHARFRLVQGAGHAIPLTHPEAVITAVRDLLD